MCLPYPQAGWGASLDVLIFSLSPSSRPGVGLLVGPEGAPMWGASCPPPLCVGGKEGWRGQWSPGGPRKTEAGRRPSPGTPYPQAPLSQRGPKPKPPPRVGQGCRGEGEGFAGVQRGSQGGPEQGEGLRGVWGESPALGWHQATRVGRGDSRLPQAGMGAVGRLGLVHVSISWLDN